ncbi:MAG: diacylglycerol/polyprenol kinase family protein [Bdellovibrionales bacterium]
MNQGSVFLSLTPVRLKRRSDLHLARKTWHVLGVLAMVVAHHLMTTDQALRAIAMASFIFVAVDVLRHQWEPLNQFTLRLMGPFMREHERYNLAGTTYLVLGTFLIIWWFPRDIVTLTLLFLAVADPLASLIGILYGKDKLVGAKSLQGTLAAFVACTLIAFFYLVTRDLMTERILMVSLLAGLSGALSELLPVGRLDDNFTFPLVSACSLWLIFTMFGGLL